MWRRLSTAPMPLSFGVDMERRQQAQGHHRRGPPQLELGRRKVGARLRPGLEHNPVSATSGPFALAPVPRHSGLAVRL